MAQSLSQFIVSVTQSIYRISDYIFKLYSLNVILRDPSAVCRARRAKLARRKFITTGEHTLVYANHEIKSADVTNIFQVKITKQETLTSHFLGKNATFISANVML